MSELEKIIGRIPEGTCSEGPLDDVRKTFSRLEGLGFIPRDLEVEVIWGSLGACVRSGYHFILSRDPDEKLGEVWLVVNARSTRCGPVYNLYISDNGCPEYKQVEEEFIAGKSKVLSWVGYNYSKGFNHTFGPHGTPREEEMPEVVRGWLRKLENE